MTLKDAINEFLMNITIERNLSKNTVFSYKRDLNYFKRFLTDKKIVTKITIDDIEKFITNLRKDGLNESSIVRNISTIKSFFKFMLDEDIITNNITVDIQKVKIPNRLPKALSTNEIFLIIESVNGVNKTDLRNRAILELLYATGARVSEIVNLQLEDINWSDEYVKLFGKGSKTRIVPVGNSALKNLKKYIIEARPELLKENKPFTSIVFINSRGDTMTRYSIFNIIKKTADQVGLKTVISPHIFRHSFATHLISGGADTRIVQELLGHSSLSTTQIYTKITVDHLREVYALSHPRA